MRIATYTRISTDEVNQPYSLGAQSERLASYVASQEDWEIVGTFTDQMSGAKLERPGLTNALRAAKAGRFDLLLVYRVDRLSRSVRGLAEVLETLDAAGVGFRSATEPFDTTSAAGRMWASTALTDIHHQGRGPGKDVQNGHHGKEEAPSPSVVHTGVQV